jgi:hypothetical protein
MVDGIAGLVLCLSVSTAPCTDGERQLELSRLTTSAKARLCADHAHELYEWLCGDGDTGGVSTLLGRLTWSKRWMEGETRLTNDERKLRALSDQHLARVRRERALISELIRAGHASEEALAVVDFYFAEAELFVCQRHKNLPTKLATEAAREMVEAAGRVYACDIRLASAKGRVVDGSGVGTLYLLSALAWSKSWLLAECLMEHDRRKREAAGRHHRERVKSVAALRTRMAGPPHTENGEEVRFYESDAELFLLNEQGKPDESHRIVRYERERLKGAMGAYQRRFAEIRDGPGSIESLYEWSKHVRLAELGLAGTRQDKIKAREAHLQRMNELRQVIQSKYNGRSRFANLLSEFLCAEASLLCLE